MSELDDGPATVVFAAVPPDGSSTNPPASAPPPSIPAPVPLPATDTVTCPECGTVAVATLNRRDAVDFCRTCDFPLFWTPTTLLRDPASDSAADALRRLPGTVGRATLAALPCPHCAEPNQLGAQVCVRCGRPMHVEAPPPPPEPVYVPPPAPVYVPPPVAEPSRWWVWLLLALGAATTIVLVVLAATHQI